jgi:glycosyltransferase involved in cell wall biosynthesis
VNVLLIAPQPFYQERGTPIAVRLLAQALCSRGHRVDLLTYHLGADVSIEGLRLLRIPRVPGVRRMPIGFSPQKLLCDAFLFFSAARRILSGRYQALHCVEESIFFTLALPKRGARVVYDMDSSMGDQMIEKWPRLRILGRLFDAFERLAVRRADLVLPMCDALAEKVRGFAPRKPLRVLADIALPEPAARGEAEDIRRGLPPDAILALYVGNLESYQGVDLLLDALASPGLNPRVHAAIIGGEERDVSAARERVGRLGIGAKCRLLGPRPVPELSRYLRQADILLSPRLRGVNTPMKIYSYLAAGRAILATRIGSHTQVLDGKVALLVEPDAASIAAGLTQLAANAELRRALGAAAATRAAERHTYPVFAETVAQAYRTLEG